MEAALPPVHSGRPYSVFMKWSITFTVSVTKISAAKKHSFCPIEKINYPINILYNSRYSKASTTLRWLASFCFFLGGYKTLALFNTSARTLAADTKHAFSETKLRPESHSSSSRTPILRESAQSFSHSSANNREWYFCLDPSDQPSLTFSRVMFFLKETGRGKLGLYYIDFGGNWFRRNLAIQPDCWEF